MPRPPAGSLAERLKLARKKRGLSQETLAELSGLKQSDISKLETNRIAKTTGMARLARALRVSDQWLELGEGDEPDWDGGIPVVPQGSFSLGTKVGVSHLELTAPEHDHILALRDLPDQEREELFAHVMARAKDMRAFADRILRERFGITGYASNDRVTDVLPAPPPATPPPPAREQYLGAKKALSKGKAK